MPQSFLAKAAVLGLIIGALSSCQESTDTTTNSTLNDRARKITPIPSVFAMFSCKPPENAFVAAHRGTQENSIYPENSLTSLKALHSAGIKFAEIDVARLKDGTQILYHDGEWDRKSTGKGLVVTTDWKKSQTFLLKDTQGNISASRPSSFKDVLNWAYGKMYLEIDFKSSVSEEKIIDSIREAGMINQVILISYSPEQALRLHTLAPKAALSVGIFKPSDIKDLEKRGIPVNVMTAWTGRDSVTKPLANALRTRNIPILDASFFSLDDALQKSKDFEAYTKFARLPDLIVSDFPFQAHQVLDLKGETLKEFQKCLAEK